MKLSILCEEPQNEILIEDLILTKQEIAQAVSNLARGMPSQTTGPLLVMLHKAKNKYQLVNGYHRVVEALMRGEDSVIIKNTGIANWKLPKTNELFIPDFNQKYFGMEEFIEHYELRNL